ncbi:MAG: hypothetical protein LBI96_07430 [Odoribacteraceae bacterium]|jgi:hypothetical protein|nr:hypothetical protein [Odoribacteraceae bacterium]
MTKNHRLLAACLLVASLFACTREDKIPTIEEILAMEKTRIHAFLEGKTYTAIPHEYTDIYNRLTRDTIYVFNNDPTGKTPATGQFALVDYDEMAFNGAYIASTDPSRFIGEGLRVPYPFGGPACISFTPLSDGSIIPFCRAIQEISEGSSGEIVLSSALAGRGAGDYFYGRVQMHRVIPDIVAYERKLITDYIDTLRFGGATDADIFVEKSPTGDSITRVTVTHCQPSTGDTIAAFTTIELTGTVYMLNEPALATPPDFLKRRVLTIGESQPVSCTLASLTPYIGQQAIHRLRKGDEATLIVPFSVMDKVLPIFDLQEETSIPPYSTLVYRIKIEDAR